MSRRLTDLQLRALTLINAYVNWTDPKQIGFGMGLETGDPLRKSYRVWNQLHGFGYIDALDNSEQVRGEPRQHYTEYRINRHGRMFLDELNGTVSEDVWMPRTAASPPPRDQR